MRNIVLLSISLFLISCGSNPRSHEAAASEKPIVCTVNYPLYYFAREIGGELFRIEYPIPDDVDPAYWIPGDETLTLYQSADMIITNGASYAKWMNNVSLPSSRIINSTASLEDKYIQLKDITSHSHGPEGEHEHTGYAFTTWLDFEIAAEQAKAVKTAFLKKMPESNTIITENYKSLNADLLALHESMKALSEDLEKQDIMASHPVYQYLARAYGLNIRSVHFEPEKMPSAKQWKKFDHLLEHYPSAKIMLWEKKPTSEIREMLDKRAIRVVVFDPCGNQSEAGDFMEIMNQNIARLTH